ncbi:MAG: hypothetical protein IKQ94_09595 [Bacteroidales bacterium]|nr:hypothetical protein [Bacteroidales bacterium]
MKQNLRTIGSLVAICAMIVMAASCKKDNLSEGDNQLVSGVERHINASAAIPQGADKAYLDETDGRKVKWESGDAINVNGTNLPLARMYANATSATFEGTAYAIPSGGNDIYWAVYPTTSAGAASGSTIPSNFTASNLTVNFPATQTYDASANALSGNTLMAGYASVPTGEEQIVFQMRNLGAVLKLHLATQAGVANTHASKLVFSTTNGALAGDFTVDNSVTPTITPAASAAKTFTLNLTDGTNNYIDISSGADIYVILPPMESKNLSMTILNTDNKCTIKNIASATMARNSIYTNTIDDVCFCCPDGFSVSASQRVVFAPGNLQWSATGGGTTATTHATADGLGGAGTWRFAEHQWDYVGNATAGNVYGVGGDLTVKCNNANIAQDYQGWIDLFGWGTSGYDNTANDQFAFRFQPWECVNTPDVDLTYNRFGYGPSKNMTDPNLVGTSANYDWGVYNAIYNPKTNTTDPAGTWRTPTYRELLFVINNRATCSGVRYAKAQVDGVNGLILVPDNWDVSIYPLNSTNAPDGTFNANVISYSDWNTILEAAGCVFLPAAGDRYVHQMRDVGAVGYYSSSTQASSSGAYILGFLNDKVYPTPQSGSYAVNRSWGWPVRLVKEVH